MKDREKLKLVTIKQEYCNYLRRFDNKVPYNYDNKKNRPFIGVLFEINDCFNLHHLQVLSQSIK